MSDFLIDEELLAAIDMGSNSFHLAIARVDHGEVKKVASMSEKVQLAAGLDENKNLTEAMARVNLSTIDAKVSIDLKRILRLPSSLHSKVSMKCMEVKNRETFDPLQEAVPKFVEERGE